jgi:hypothetical protein
MKHYILLITAILLFNLSHAQVDLFEFTAQFGSGSVFVDEAESVQLDTDGNIILYGTFEEETDFDFGPDELIIEPLGLPDLFLAKYQPDGTLLWVNTFGRIALDNGIFADEVLIQSDGTIVISGAFTSTVDFDPGVEVNNLVSNGGADGFVAKYDADGAFISAVGFGGSGTELCSGLAMDENDNLYVGLRFNSDVDVDPGDSDVILSSSGAADAAVIKYASDGSYVLSHQIGTAGNDQILSLATGPAGEIILGAFVDGSTSGFPQQELYVEVLSPEGVSLWQYDFNNPATNNYITSIAMSQDGGAFYLAGRVQASTDFDPSEEAEEIISPQFADVFMAKYNLADGQLEWARNIQGAGVEDYCASIKEAGQAFMIAGSFEDFAIFDPGDFSTQVVANGDGDMFFAAYDRETGAYIDVQTFGGDGWEQGITGAFDEMGSLVVAGRFSGNLDLSPEGGQQIDAAGFFDFFFALFQYDTDLSSNIGVDTKDISIYPVPAQDFVYIGLPSQLITHNLEVKVISVVGQVVAKYKLTGSRVNERIDISGLNKGIYLLEFNFGGQSLTKRIIKN